MREFALVALLAAVLAGIAVWTLSATQQMIANLLGFPEAQSFQHLKQKIERAPPPAAEPEAERRPPPRR